MTFVYLYYDYQSTYSRAHIDISFSYKKVQRINENYSYAKIYDNKKNRLYELNYYYFSRQRLHRAEGEG